jgi:hypothetical protein
MCPRRKGEFRLEPAAEWEGRKRVLKVAPQPVRGGKDTMPMYGVLSHRTGIPVPGKPTEIGLWINGNSLKSADAPGLVEAGRAGVIAIAGTTPEFGVRYDNFVVRAGAVLAMPGSFAGTLQRLERPWR